MWRPRRASEEEKWAGMGHTPRLGYQKRRGARGIVTQALRTIHDLHLCLLSPIIRCLEIALTLFRRSLLRAVTYQLSSMNGG
jgi:hypothetical protein